MSIDKLRDNYPVKFRWVHFPLHPETPQEGQALTELFAGRDIEPMQERMRDLMQEAGLPYGNRSHTYNSRLAQELGKWADCQPGGERIHDALFKAYFVDGVNIGERDVLVDIAAKTGLNKGEAAEVLDKRLYRETVDEDWQFSGDSGVTGVPTFTARGLMVVGCQPYEVLERFVNHLLKN